MKPKSIGIIGGAGPLAGAFLFERVLSLSNTLYKCYRDSDYPKIFLINFPFSEMLSSNINPTKLQSELSECLSQLRNCGASVIAIACNTLHAFLDQKDDLDDFVHLPRVLAKVVSYEKEKPLVFCTSTSAKFGLHKQFFSCTYPNIKTQCQVDEIIDQILKGENKSLILEKLQQLIQEQSETTVILGCTELSLFSSGLSIPNKQIIDPLDVVANKILQKCFIN